MFVKLKRKRKIRRKRGGIKRHRFTACAKRCRGDKGCMSACLKRHA